MGCPRLTCDFEPNLFLQEQGGKTDAPELSVWVNPEGAFGGVGGEVLTQGSVQFNYEFSFSDPLLKNPPRVPGDLGVTYIDGRASKITQNSSGSLDIVLTIKVALNSAFLWDFGSRNPGLLYQVTTHELGHGLQIEDAFMSAVNGRLDLPYSANDESLKAILNTFIQISNGIMNSNSNLESNATERGINFYAPNGYKPPYDFFNPIKW